MTESPGVRLAGVCAEGGDEFAAATDAELVENRSEVFLDGVRGDAEFVDDLLGGVTAEDVRGYPPLGGCDPVCGEHERRELIGIGRVEHDDGLGSGISVSRPVVRAVVV